MPNPYDRIRCAVCGLLPPRLANFGLTQDGAFDPEQAPAHELALVRATFAGRGRLSYERFNLPFAMAVGLRDALKAALARLESEIGEANGD
jgi:hypothetical protein